MNNQRHDYALLAEKLIETFATMWGPDYPFERYWRIVPALEAFCETATGTLEHEVAKALRSVLERRLKESAPGSFHIHAETVGSFLGARPRPKKKRS